MELNRERVEKIRKFVERRSAGVDTDATIYECCSLFDLCADDALMGLSFAGQEPFLDWLTWQPSLECIIRKAFIPWIRPENCASAVQAYPCEAAHKGEFGVCEFELRDFGRLRMESPVRDITTNAMMLCRQQPRYRLDGSLIGDTQEWDMRVAMETLLQSLKSQVIIGNDATPGSFDGLQQTIKTAYTDPEGRACASMDSVIIDWNGNPMSGGNGITWNGSPVANTFDLIDVLLAAFRQVRRRISWAPTLAAQRWSVGDTVLVMPSFLIDCLLDFFTCWTVCTDNDSYKVLGTLEGRRFRDSLLGKLFGYGAITLDGLEIPVIAYDWGTIQGPTRGDIYMLTGRLGGVRLLEGQYLDMRPVPQSGYTGAGSEFEVYDGGRILTWMTKNNTCVVQSVEMRPRLLNWAPWAQVRIEDVACRGAGPVLSPDPCETSFFIETSFTAAACAIGNNVAPSQ